MEAWQSALCSTAAAAEGVQLAAGTARSKQMAQSNVQSLEAPEVRTGVKPLFCRPLTMGTISSSLSHRTLRRWNALQGWERASRVMCDERSTEQRRLASGERRRNREARGH